MLTPSSVQSETSLHRKERLMNQITPHNVTQHGTRASSSVRKRLSSSKRPASSSSICRSNMLRSSGSSLTRGRFNQAAEKTVRTARRRSAGACRRTVDMARHPPACGERTRPRWGFQSRPHKVRMILNIAATALSPTRTAGWPAQLAAPESLSPSRFRRLLADGHATSGELAVRCVSIEGGVSWRK